jgi:hypothetical protein
MREWTDELRGLPALSVMQPWAWLLAHGHKPVENRVWGTKVRGPLLIHAGQKFDRDGYDWMRAYLYDLARREPDRIPFLLPLPSTFERGGIVGVARLVDCVTAHPSPFFFGPYGFVLEEAAPLPFRACRGMLGFFRPTLTAPLAAPLTPAVHA